MSAAPTPPRAAVRLQLLGTPRLFAGEHELRFPDRRAVGLLALVASEGAVPRERAAALLWDAEGDTDTRRNLRRELHRMREAGLDGVIDSGGKTLALHPGIELDTAAFQRACTGGDAASALALYGTGLLPGFELHAAPAFNDWLAARREALAQTWRAIADTQARALQDRGDLRGALAVAQALIAQDQLQEAHYRRAMSLHALLGEREAALDAYERCQRALGRQLGLRPLAATTELAEQIRSGRSTPAPAPAPVPSTGAALAVALPELTAPVGREALLAEIERHLTNARLTAIEGVAGVGKTTVLRSLRSRRPASSLHETRASDARVPFAALSRWLRAGLGGDAAARPGASPPSSSPGSPSWPTWVSAELARLLPELGPAPAPIAAESQRLRFFEAIRVAWRTSFAASECHLFDDWQFVDDASAQWWRWWQGQGDGPRLLVAARPGEARAEAAAALASALQESHAAPIAVPALDEAGMLSLVQRLSGVDRPERFASRLGRATGGNPFFAIETLRHLIEQGLIHVDGNGRWATPFDADTADYRELPIAPSVQAAVAHRVDALDEPTRRLLEAACLTGDDFRLELVSGATALGEWEAVAALETALRARIVRRHAEASGLYRFEHDLFAQVIAASLSPERLALMHRALGNKLAQGGADPARVAEHFERGGDVAAAQRHRLLALEAARRRHAVSDMIDQSERLLALSPPPAAALAAHLAAATAWRSRADAPRSRQALARTTGLLRVDDDPALHVQLLLATAEEALREGHPETALAALGARLNDPALHGDERGRLLRARGDALRVLGRPAEALLDLNRALDAFGDEPSQARGDLFDSLARAALIGHDPRAALSHAEQCTAVMRAIDHPLGISSALILLGLAHLVGGRTAAAWPPLEEARQLAARHGLLANERRAILNLVPVLLKQGRTDEASKMLDEGFALSALFSAKAEEHAFVEARYHCRVVVGDLGGALELRPRLVALSLDVGDHHRMLSGLLVAVDLPLLVGDLDAAAATLASIRASLAAGEAGQHRWGIEGALARLAQGRGDPAATEAAVATDAVEPSTDEDRNRQLIARFVTATPAGGVALPPVGVETRGDAAPDTWACLLAVALAAQAASGGVSAATVAAAEHALGAGDLPKLSALQLIDALLAVDGGRAWHDEGRTLFATLGRSLASHPRERALFEAKYRRLG